MKLRKVLLNVLTLATVASGVIGLAACADEQDKTTSNGSESTQQTNPGTDNSKPETGSSEQESTGTKTEETNQDQQILDASVKAIKLEASYDADFTLPVKGNGTIAYSWASSNPDVVTIDGANAKVTRPVFGQEAVEVTLTVTGTFNDATATKEFKVTINPLVDESISVAEIKATEDEKIVQAKGVVTGFGYSKGHETPGSFYITDATGTIFVFGANVAKTLSIGDEVYFSAKKTTYKGCIQLSEPTEAHVLKSDVEADWTTVIRDKQIKDVAKDLEGDHANEVYEFVGRVYKNNYGTYSIQDKDDHNNGNLGDYLGGSDGTIPADYAKLLQGHEDEVIKVRFVINSKNSKGTAWRGHVLAVLPFNVEEQKELAPATVKNAIDALELGRVMEAKEVVLPASFATLPDTKITYTLEGAGVTLVDGKLTFAPTAALQKAVLKVSIQVGENAPTELAVNMSIATTFEAQKISEVLAMTEDGASVIVQGKVLFQEKYNAIIFDGNDMILINSPACENLKVNSYIKVYGKLDVYENNRTVKLDDLEELEDLKLETPANVAITNEIAAPFANKDGAGHSAVAVEFTADVVVKDGKYVNMTIAGVDYTFSLKSYLPNDQKGALNGKTVTITGFLVSQSSHGNYLNIFATSIEEKVLTDAEKLALTEQALTEQLTLGTVDAAKTIELANPQGATLSVVLPEAAKTLAYDSTKGTLTITPLEAETTEVLTIKITVGAEAKEIKFNIVSKLPEVAVEAQKLSEVVTLPNDTEVVVDAKVVAATDDDLVLYDGTDMISVHDNQSKNYAVGDYVRITGTVSNFKNVLQIKVATIAKIETLNIEDPVASDLTDEMLKSLTCAESERSDVFLATFTGTVAVSGSHINVLYPGLKGYDFGIKNPAEGMNALEGKRITVTAYVNGASFGHINAFMTSYEEVPYTDTEKVQLTEAALTAQFELGTVAAVKELVLENPHNVTLDVKLQDAATTLVYDAVKTTLTITPTASEVSETLTITITSGSESKAVKFTVVSKLFTENPDALKATMAYSGTESGNLVKDANNAKSVGLDETLFTVTAKNGSPLVGLGSDSTLRLYKANELIVTASEGVTITSIKLTLKKPKKAAGTYTVNGVEGVVDYENPQIFVVNGNSFNITNSSTATAQVWFTSIEISYTVAAK